MKHALALLLIGTALGTSPAAFAGTQPGFGDASRSRPGRDGDPDRLG